MSTRSLGAGRQSTRLTFSVPAHRRDELIAELWALGTSGIEVIDEGDHDLLEVYFETAAQPSAGDRERIARRCEATLTRTHTVDARDWLADYRAGGEPIAIGPLVIDPREPDEAAPSALGDVLRIPARDAFGTGSHESTRLILEELVEIGLEGRSVLDVGTGSAILALAALRRGARRVVGFDIDVGSVVTAGDNARLNGLAPALFAGTVEALAGEFDVVLVNILPHRWIDQAPAIVDCLGSAGELLVSGLLSAEAEAVLARLSAIGLLPTARREAGEWVCFSFSAGS